MVRLGEKSSPDISFYGGSVVLVNLPDLLPRRVSNPGNRVALFKLGGLVQLGALAE